MMRRLLGLLSVLALIFVAGQAFADVYDDAWIRQCIQDNLDQGQSASTIRIYCACMNGKMSSEEARSITEWEKTHPEEREFCSDLARWKGR